jgi:hypothetical protein
MHLQRAFAVGASPQHGRVRGDVADDDPVRDDRLGVAGGPDGSARSRAGKSEDGRSEDQVRDPGHFLNPLRLVRYVGRSYRTRASGARDRVAVRIFSMAQEISKTAKTSLTLDRRKAAEVREILGTKTLVETVDAAFDEVIRLAARRRVLDRIRHSETGGIGPTPDELRALRQP